MIMAASPAGPGQAGASAGRIRFPDRPAAGRAPPGPAFRRHGQTRSPALRRLRPGRAADFRRIGGVRPDGGDRDPDMSVALGYVGSRTSGQAGRGRGHGLGGARCGRRRGVAVSMPVRMARACCEGRTGWPSADSGIGAASSAALWFRRRWPVGIALVVLVTSSISCPRGARACSRWSTSAFAGPQGRAGRGRVYQLAFPGYYFLWYRPVSAVGGVAPGP